MSTDPGNSSHSDPPTTMHAALHCFVTILPHHHSRYYWRILKFNVATRSFDASFNAKYPLEAKVCQPAAMA